MRKPVLIALSALLGLALLTPGPAAAAKAPLPPRALTSATIDAHLGYIPQSTCSPSAKPGAKAVLKLLIANWGGSSSGISRGCSAAGRSEHKEGRALDWHMSVKKAGQRKRVNQALAWITANNGEVALRLGIMYVIWNQQIWSVYYPELGWRKMASRGSPTANHKDHVHISLSWDGAYQQTSWWTGTPIAEPLNSRCGTNGARSCLPLISRGPASSASHAEVPASFTPAPWILPGVGGSPQVGRLQRAVAGRWVPANSTLSYQWTSDGVPIPGATDSTYLITPNQVGREVEVRVTATAGGSVITKASNNIADVYPGWIATSGLAITGTPNPASTLSVTPGTWTPAPSALRYSWQRDGKTIKGATAASFVVRNSDLGHQITVAVRGWVSGYVVRTVVSNPVKIVAVGSAGR